MRRTFVTAGMLLLLQPGFFYLWKQSTHSCCHQPDVATIPCRDIGHEPCEPTSVEDRALRNTLIRQGVSLIERGRTVDAAELIRQMNATTCQLDLPPSGPSVSDSAELFRVAKDSVVVIGGLYKCTQCPHWHANLASGFVLASHGIIVTNYHVVDAPSERALVIMTADAQVYPVRRVLAASEADDLAILQADATGLQPLPLADSTAAAPVGSAVSVISHPDGRFFCYTAGVVSRYMKIRSAGSQGDAVAITAEYARGSSGAPVLNSQGQVVAVVSSTESIYYSQEAGQQRNLQMVVRTCIPATSLRRMIRPAGQIASRTP